MKKIQKPVSILFVLVLCLSSFSHVALASAVPYSSTIFGSYSVYLPSSMNAEFQVTTRKTVASVSITASLQVKENGRWKTISTGISPSFSGSNKNGWLTTADYSSVCAKGETYHLVVTYSSSGASVTYTSNERTY